MSNMDNTASTPRCTTRGCPTRFRDGQDRACAMHTDDASDSVLGRMAAFAALSATPGEHEHQDDGEGTKA